MQKAIKANLKKGRIIIISFLVLRASYFEENVHRPSTKGQYNNIIDAKTTRNKYDHHPDLLPPFKILISKS